MKKRGISVIMMLCMAITMVSFNTDTVAAADIPSLSDKSIYYVPDYVSGDCNLSSNAHMLKRMAILLKSPGYKSLTNTNLRGKISYNGGDGKYNDMYFTYSYRNGSDGVTFSVKNGNFTKGKQASKIRELLKTHPEGIVVYDNRLSKGYPHAVLITGYNKKNGKFYCVDSALNYGKLNRGVTYFNDSIMDSISGLDQYWYLSSTSLRTMGSINVRKYDSSRVRVTYYDIYAQNRYQISKSTSKTGTNIIATYNTNISQPKYVTAKRNVTYYYKMRGYNTFNYTPWDGKTRTKTIYGGWSTVKDFKLK